MKFISKKNFQKLTHSILILLIFLLFFKFLNIRLFYRYQDKRRDLFIELIGIDMDYKLKKDEVIKLEDVAIQEGIRRQKILLPGSYNQTIPCYFFYHENNLNQPAIIVPPGHGEGIIETAGLQSSYQKSNALEIAKAGFATITCENRGQGELKYYLKLKDDSYYKLDQIPPDLIFPQDYDMKLLSSLEVYNLPKNEQRYYFPLETAKLHQVVGVKSYNALILSDNRLAIDYLESIDFIDKNFLGIAGVSQGGSTSLYLAAIDPRLKATVVMGWLTNWVELLDDDEDWRIPGIDIHFPSMAEVAMLVIPRYSLYHNGGQEAVKVVGVGFPADTARLIFNQIKLYYLKALAPSKTQFHSYDIEHEFVNQLAVDFLEQSFNQKNSTRNDITQLLKIKIKHFLGIYDYQIQE